MKITWQKTRVEAVEQVNDYTAMMSSGIDVGRIYKIVDGVQAGLWQWAFLLGRAQFRSMSVSGQTVSIQTAKTEVVKTFERYLDTPGSDGGGQSRIPVKREKQGS